MIHADGTVEVSITIAAKPATIFRYFTDPGRFGQWVQGAVTLDPRTGGDLRVAFAQGANVVEGQIVELVENERIVMTWGLADDTPEAAQLPAGSTRVAVTLAPVTDGTRVTLRHEGLVESLRGAHEGGWVYYFSQLSPKASAEHYAGIVGATLDAFMRAWNEPDATNRAEALAAAFASDGEYRGKYGVCQSASELDAHIAACQKFIPGVIVRRVGDWRLAHGHVLHDWELVRGNATVERGSDVSELTLEGKIRKLVSFPAQP